MMEFGLTGEEKKSYYRKERPALQIIGLRLVFAAVLIMVVAGVFWGLEKDHIKDENEDGDFSYFDSLYFTVVTVTTVGYGDIVPVTEEARMFDALIITPVRIIVWVLFIGTAYQFVIRRFWEESIMKRQMKKMKNHVIVAGYGTTGEATVRELLTNGYEENSLVVVDRDEDRVKEAAEAGATGVLGNPTSEDALLKAGIHQASVLIITLPRDDTDVLITLTARDLNPDIRVISQVSQEENIKLLRRAGADIIISPALTGGNLMAMAVWNRSSAELMGDLLTSIRGVNVHQRKVQEGEVGTKAKSVPGIVVIGVVRKGKNIEAGELDGIVLKPGDEIIYLG